MSNTVCNAVTHTVSNAVRNRVQNQNQNQSLLKAVCGSPLLTQSQIVKAVGVQGGRRIGFGAMA